MARAYTAELRERVLRACARGGLSRAALAQLFGVGESTLYRWQQIWRAEGRREAHPERQAARGPRRRSRTRAAPPLGWMRRPWAS